ncbi:MAG TPA: NAD(P)-dependent oxidoreductase [Aliidongia sp.]|uniref:NAD(P)-dependent oxidoreductase n=1 Tax=Aliidongia sp. TaxID=1914230 RepID=UPI002DDD30D8|nr:NAD(P)-dependent oxidoreductase [Aliidongia sp.]HEV2673053.1 NAD(P)-dependent oxidoreductase [Aliidongia sp.]
MAKSSVAFIGTGAIGSPMAFRLLQAAFPLVVNNRRRQGAETLIDAGAAWAETAAAAAEHAELIFTCLPSIEAMDDVCFGPSGIMSGGKPRCVVDLSTTGPDDAFRIGARLNAGGIAFIDAPVTGGVPRAREGKLTVIASGDPDEIEFARPAFETIGSTIVVVGSKCGQAQTVKLINNMLNYTAMAATCEAMVLGVKAGIDPNTILQVVNTGSGRNSATEVKFPLAILPRTFDFGATNRVAAKDLSLFLGVAENLSIPTPVASFISQLWRTWLPTHGDEDMTTLVKMFEQWAGVEVSGK